MSGWPLDVLRDTAGAMLGYDATAKVETHEGRGISRRRREEIQHTVKREERVRKGEGLESQRERLLIRLGDDSPMLDIYSIRREGGRYVTEGGASGKEGKLLGRCPRRHHCARQQWVALKRERPQWRKTGGKQGECDWAQPTDDRLKVEMRKCDRNREEQKSIFRKAHCKPWLGVATLHRQVLFSAQDVEPCVKTKHTWRWLKNLHNTNPYPFSESHYTKNPNPLYFTTTTSFFPPWTTACSFTLRQWPAGLTQTCWGEWRAGKGECF